MMFYFFITLASVAYNHLQNLLDSSCNMPPYIDGNHLAYNKYKHCLTISVIVFIDSNVFAETSFLDETDDYNPIEPEPLH